MQRMRCMSCVNAAELECNFATSTDAVLVSEGDVTMRQTHVSVVLALVYTIKWYMRIKCWRYKKKTTLLCLPNSVTHTDLCRCLSFPASEQEDPRFEPWWSQVLSAQGKMRSHALLVLVFGSAWCSGLRFPSDTCALQLILPTKSSFLQHEQQGNKAECSSRVSESWPTGFYTPQPPRPCSSFSTTQNVMYISYIIAWFSSAKRRFKVLKASVQRNSHHLKCVCTSLQNETANTPSASSQTCWSDNIVSGNKTHSSSW